MVSPLLTTKLDTPPLRSDRVPRFRLTQRLDEGVNSGHLLTLISAPAGFGKTTLISEWIGRGERPVAWLALGEEDNDPVQFFTYLIASLQRIDAAVGQTAQQILGSPQLPPPQNLITSLINDITAADLPLILVLDDYHLITTGAIHQVVAFLLEHQPPLMHVVVSTREDPPFPLARLRVRNEVTEIRERDLRFTLEETTTFLHQTMNLPLLPENVEALEVRTEGWIAGLQLAALAIQEDRENAEAFIAAFTGDDRYVVDYLITEVLQRQPEVIRDFLRQTAILDRLTASLCHAVTGREDSQAIIEQLEAANLFLIPLDHRREWYRYYHLFSEFLRATLGPDERKRLHCQAMRWYEAHGYTSQAIQHALAYASASGDLDDAERLIGLAAEATIHRGGLQTLSNWLDALPDERLRANWELATYKGWISILAGQVALAEDYANSAEQRLHESEASGPDMGRLLLLRCYIALGKRDYEAVAQFAAGALLRLEENQLRWRIMALWAMAEAQERTRSITEAIVSLREAGRIGSALGHHVFPAVIEASLASALNEHGQRQDAVTVCEKAIVRCRTDQGQPSPIAAVILGRLAILEYEANRFDLARQYLDQCMTFSEQLAVGDLLVFSHGISALILSAQGRIAESLSALQKASQLSTTEGLSDNGWLTALEVNIRLKQGDVQFAARWAESAAMSLDSVPQYLRADEHLAYARLLLAQNRLADVHYWLSRLERFAQEHDLCRKLITIRILQALLAERSGDRSTALDYLAQAVQIAAPEHYFRAFIDEDEQVFVLLRFVRHAAPAFVGQLLAGAGTPRSGLPTPTTASQFLIEPLSERELEVLGMIAAGLSNAEIGRKLFITTGTVKRHINHVYGKLEVHSRTQAIVKARELSLLANA